MDESKSSLGSNAIDADYEHWSARRLVHHLVHSEIVSAYRILSTIGEKDQPSFAFYDGDRWSAEAVSGCAMEELGNVFTAIRTLTSRTLKQVPDTAYLRPCRTTRERTLKDLVIDTVEHAGRHVQVLTSQVRSQRRRIPGQK